MNEHPTNDPDEVVPTPSESVPPPAPASPGRSAPDAGDGKATLPTSAVPPSSLSVLAGDLTGHSVGAYRVVRFLGAGGMARVYEAFDTRLQRRVALKVLRSNDPDSARRMIREAQAQAQVPHAGVCPIYEAGEDAGHPFIAMRLIEGDSLDRAAPAMCVRERVGVVRQVAEALHSAHREGLIHRDIKPSNILLERAEDGDWKAFVTDFGLARVQGEAGLTATGEVMGTPRFMAPEQARGHNRDLDARTDVYALGATLYEILCGQPLFTGDNPVQIVLQVVNREPVTLRRAAPQVHADLDTIVMKCLDKEPARRYATARDLADDLGRFLDGDPILARPTTRLYRLYRRARKNRLAVAVAVAAVLAILGLSAYGLRQRWLADERLRLAGIFGQEVRYIEERVRYARTRPRHDIRPELDWARGQAAELEARVRRSGEAGAGPGQYALGRCAMLLGEYEKAHAHLQAAWQEHGYQNPEVALSLGMTLAHLYEQEWARLIQDTPGTELARQLKEINTRYREPALRYIRHAGPIGGESPELIEARVDSLESRCDEALRKASRVRMRSPWRYEARALEGEILVQMGVEQIQRGELAPGLEILGRAETALRDASSQAPSDENLFLALANLNLTRLREQIAQTGRAETTVYDQTQTDLQDALTIRPDSAYACYLLGLTAFQWAEYQMRTGGDPAPALELAATSARRVIALEPRNPRSHTLLGAVSQLRGSLALARGRDPRGDLAEAVRALTEAVRLAPDDSAAYLQLGNTRYLEANLELMAGRSPVPACRRAMDSYRQAARLDQTEPYLFYNMGATQAKIVEYNLTHGGDTREDLAEAIALLERSLRLNPALLDARFMLAVSHLLSARQAALAGQDPGPAAARVDKAARRMIEAKTASGSAYQIMAIVRLVVGGHLLRQGGSPAAQLERARELVRRGLATGQSAARLWLTQGRIELLEARWRLAGGGSPLTALEQADAACRQAGKGLPPSADILTLQAEINLIRGEWAASRGQPAGPSIGRGLAQAAQARALAPDSTQPQAVAGALLRLRARTAGTAAERSRDDRLGRDELARALGANPALRQTFGRYLDGPESVKP